MAILILGLTSAAFTYEAPATPRDASQYRIVGETVYPVHIEDANADVAALEIYGGNAAVIIASFNRKCIALFRGKNLTYFLGTVSIVLALACFLGAWRSRRPS